MNGSVVPAPLGTVLTARACDSIVVGAYTRGHLAAPCSCHGALGCCRVCEIQKCCSSCSKNGIILTITKITITRFQSGDEVCNKWGCMEKTLWRL